MDDSHCPRLSSWLPPGVGGRVWWGNCGSRDNHLPLSCLHSAWQGSTCCLIYVTVVVAAVRVGHHILVVSSDLIHHEICGSQTQPWLLPVLVLARASCNRRNPDLRQWLPLAHISTAAVGLSMSDPAATSETTPAPGWHDLPSVREALWVPQPQRLSLLRQKIPSMRLGQVQLVPSKPLFSSQSCRRLTSVHLGCQLLWHIQMFT